MLAARIGVEQDHLLTVSIGRNMQLCVMLMYRLMLGGSLTSEVIPISLTTGFVALIVAVAVIILYYVYRWKPAKELEKELDDNILRKFEVSRREVDVCGYAHKLGSGAFGCVFMGWISPETSEAERVAVKELKKDAGLDVKRDFIREAKISLRVQHPNVVRLMYVCSQDEPYLMIMELINMVYSLCNLINTYTCDSLVSLYIGKS